MAKQRAELANQIRAAKLPPDPKKLPDFTDTDIEDIHEAFNLFDKDDTGVIDLNQMLNLLEVLKVNERNSTVFHLIEQLYDEFPDGVTFKNFMEHTQVLVGDLTSREGLARLFELLDVEGKEYLDKERLQGLASEIGENPTEEEVDGLIENYYECPNGKIDIDSFYKMIIKSAF